MRAPNARLAIPVVVMLALASCGIANPFVNPTPEPPRDVVIETTEPPPLFINGVAGRAISWCWVTSCVDGAIPEPDGLPEVTAPFELQVPENAAIEGISVYLRGDMDRRNPVNVAHTELTLGPVPEGAVILTVFVFLEPSGDAFYAWALEP